MQTTATRTAGSHTDLLTGILNVQVRNEDKITEQDRQYCQLQQDQLYRTLDRIDRWYDIFKEEAERYREIKSFKYENNGKVSIRNFYFNNSGEDDYTHNEFKPFDLINEFKDADGNDIMQQQIDRNYSQIKADVLQIIEDEITRIKNDPELRHLIPQQEEEENNDGE